MKRSWPSGLLVLLLIGCGKDLSVPQLSLDQGEGTNVWQAAALGRVEPAFHLEAFHVSMHGDGVEHVCEATV